MATLLLKRQKVVYEYRKPHLPLSFRSGSPAKNVRARVYVCERACMHARLSRQISAEMLRHHSKLVGTTATAPPQKKQFALFSLIDQEVKPTDDKTAAPTGVRRPNFLSKLELVEVRGGASLGVRCGTMICAMMHAHTTW